MTRHAVESANHPGRIGLIVKANVHAQLTQVAYQVLTHSGLARWSRRAGAMVYCYHNVVTDDLEGSVGEPSLHTGVTRFGQQVEWIKRAFTVVPITELVARIRSGRSVTRLAVITFDDGYAGVVRHAIPVLRAADVPFTIFPVIDAATNLRPFWWDVIGGGQGHRRAEWIVSMQGDHDQIVGTDVNAADLPSDLWPASWEMLRSASGADCTIGVHSVTHRNLTTLAPDVIDWELRQSRSRIEEELGVVPQILSYPYGKCDATVRAAAERAGFAAAFTLERNVLRMGTEPFTCPRVDIPARIPHPNFVCWASGLRMRG
jgi:peptidoglycan/xylan/chitin deacetylase (PgdA/CDA1 family)